MLNVTPQTNNVLVMIGEVVRSVVPKARVVLFGSHARGTAAPMSDYDILVVTEQSLLPKDKLALRTQVRKRLLEKRILSDVLVQSDEEIRRKKNLPGHIVRSILRDGVAL